MISERCRKSLSRRLRVWGASLFAEERRTLWNNNSDSKRADASFVITPKPTQACHHEPTKRTQFRTALR
jgi:hypothetical protein